MSLQPWIAELRTKQKDALCEALGGPHAGWRPEAFTSSEEILRVVKANYPDLSDVHDVGELAKRLGVDLHEDEGRLRLVRAMEGEMAMGQRLMEQHKAFKGEQLREWQESAKPALTERK